MSLGAIVMLALGLAMDATAVAAARGLAATRLRFVQVARISLLFGAAQALMPLLGWQLGAWIGPWVRAYSHWLSFALLVGLGGKMLWEARPGAGDEDGAAAAPAEAPEATGASFRADAADAVLFAWRPLLGLSIATSLDAFAVGVTLPLLGAPMTLSLVTIGVVTAVCAGAGVWLGRRLGHLLGQKLDAFGGLVLVGLGVKLLLDGLRG